MKLRTLVCATFGMVIAAPGGQAQVLKADIGAGGGPALPVGGTSALADAGYNVLLFGGVESTLSPVGARFDATYVNLPFKFGSGHDDIWSASANLTYHIPAPLISPYFIGGVGYYHNAGLGPSTSRFGLNAGLGAALHIPLLFSIFGEFRYHYVFTSQNVQYIPLTIGVEL